MKTADITRGFSLIEILIVLAILGIVSSMGVYAWQRFVANNNLRTAARDLAADIARYRQRAVGENDTYTMTFDIANNKYKVEHTNDKDQDGAPDPPDAEKSPSVFGADIKLDTVGFFNAPSNITTIQPRGLLDNGTIKMTNSRDSSAEITVSSAGRTDLQFTMQ